MIISNERNRYISSSMRRRSNNQAGKNAWKAEWSAAATTTTSRWWVYLKRPIPYINSLIIIGSTPRPSVIFSQVTHSTSNSFPYNNNNNQYNGYKKIETSNLHMVVEVVEAWKYTVHHCYYCLKVKSLSLGFMCSDQHVTYWMPCGFPQLVVYWITTLNNAHIRYPYLSRCWSHLDLINYKISKSLQQVTRR